MANHPLENQIRVLDSSAVLAWILKEPGWQMVEHCLEENRCLLSLVNLAEIAAKLSDLGFTDPAQVGALLRIANIEFVELNEEQAITSAMLRKNTRDKGLSLGDRMCLALAIEKKASVLTADRTWSAVKLPIKVIDIR